jgi:phage terminase small subunit
MRQRGRKSAESNVVEIDVAALRPAPPAHLCAEDAEVWRTTVAGMKPGWFSGETWPLLELFCACTSIARTLAREVAASGPQDPRFDKLVAMHERESALLVTLATNLRLSKQSSADSRTVKHDPGGGGLRKPWD